MTDFRALCAELVDIATAHCHPDDDAVGYCAAVLSRARAALAQPKPPSLKEQALTALERYMTGETILTKDSLDTIRRALEQLDD